MQRGGGQQQFQRLISYTKKSLYWAAGNFQLTWSELEDVLLNVEVNPNNRPLTYADEEPYYSLLTMNLMIPRKIPAYHKILQNLIVMTGWKDRSNFINAKKVVVNGVLSPTLKHNTQNIKRPHSFSLSWLIWLFTCF